MLTIDDGFEAIVRFFGSHGNALELLELAEEVFDEISPFIEFAIKRQRSRTSRVLRDDDCSATLVKIGYDGIAFECFVGDQAAEVAAPKALNDQAA